GRATQLVDVEHARRGAHEHGYGTVPVPAESGDATRKLAVVLTREDGVDDERLETCIPQAASFCRPCIDVSSSECDLTRIEQDRLAQLVAVALDALLDHLDRHADELKRLLQAHRAQQFAWGRTEHIRRYPRSRLGVVEPRDKRGDAGLRDESYGAAAPRRHLPIPRECL